MDFDEIVERVANMKKKADLVATHKTIKNKGLGRKKADLVAAPFDQLNLVGIEVDGKVDGIEMGILVNGISYLTERGLARMAGVTRRTISQIAAEWHRTFDDPLPVSGQMVFIKDHLFWQGYEERNLYIEITKNNSLYYAYPDIVCTTIIEYFAFEAQHKNETAVKNFRNLARYGLQKFIYDALQYIPSDKWRYFLDRVALLKDQAPPGYFIVFREIHGLVIDLIHAGVSVNDKTIPDGSVGSCWGKYWIDHDLESQFGKRIEWDHYYPDYYPQAGSNPQPAKAYPDVALPLFRQWFRREYLTTKFPAYILRKADTLLGGTKEAKQIAQLYEQSTSKVPEMRPHI